MCNTIFNLNQKHMFLDFRCDRIMMEFLGEIKDNAKEDLKAGPSTVSSSTSPTATITKTEIEFSAMINILIMHSQSQHVTLQVFWYFLVFF